MSLHEAAFSTLSKLLLSNGVHGTTVVPCTIVTTRHSMELGFKFRVVCEPNMFLPEGDCKLNFRNGMVLGRAARLNQSRIIILAIMDDLGPFPKLECIIWWPTTAHPRKDLAAMAPMPLWEKTS